ncbi:MAG: aminoacyl-tRNA hydrolase [Acidimicrobiales bacterium]
MLKPRSGTPADLLAVGLGNPGADYERTRHNLGADVVSLLADRHGGKLKPRRATHSLEAEVRVDGRLLALALPQTFMNESGMAAAPLVRRHGIDDLARLVVIHDELDLPRGRVKVKLGGGTAGHNGLKSIQAHLHGSGFARVRIGVGKPPGRQSGIDYVLHAPRGSERAELDVAVEDGADAVEMILVEGVEAAMNRFNAA